MMVNCVLCSVDRVEIYVKYAVPFTRLQSLDRRPLVFAGSVIKVQNPPPNGFIQFCAYNVVIFSKNAPLLTLKPLNGNGLYCSNCTLNDAI